MADRDESPRPQQFDPPPSLDRSSAASSGTASPNPSKNAPSPSENGMSISALPSTVLRSLNLSNAASTSTSASPLSSRDTSPSRPNPRKNSAPAGGPSPKRSRNHSQDMSPTRPPSLQNNSGTIPSAAAIQRALSSTATPQLQPTSTQDTKTSRLQKSTGAISGDTTPHWPVSPRLKSPPPSASRSRKNSLNNLRSQQTTSSQSQAQAHSRKPETAPTPNIVVQSSTPPSSSSVTPRPTGKNEPVNSDSDDQGPITMKGSARGVSGATRALETVQEGSLPNTPGFDLDEGKSESQHKMTDSNISVSTTSSHVTKTSEDLSSRTSKSGESGSESGENQTTPKAKPVQSSSVAASKSTVTKRNSVTSLVPNKSRSVNEAKNMTVETETVPSIPQATIGPPIDRSSQSRTDPNGSLRMKASTETIRPKKERKKPARKAPSINAGTASSKADIFEAKVASAVDEADDSESDETFVYESNPPDPEPRPARHHSRTPSATSMASLVDSRPNMRTIGNVLDTHRAVPSKRSMKFASNTYNNTSPDHDQHDRGDGTVRVGAGRNNGGSSIHHHHIGRHGRVAPSIFDSDSPFPHSMKGRNSRQSSRPSSPKTANHSLRYGNGTAKQNSELSMYDMAGEAADDERTPLISNARISRSVRTSRSARPTSMQMRHYQPYQREQGGWLRRFAGCIVMTVMVVLLVAGAVGFLFATTKPLYDVKVEKIGNVLASEQEIMLDLFVRAVNPNVVTITITDMDVNVFAKSKHVGTDRWWREHPPLENDSPWFSPREKRKRGITADSRESFQPSGNKDEGTDPIEDPEGDSQTMLLGRIFHFDTALVFEGSALQRRAHYSTGEVRLSKPGNKTEAGGTERWERVLQYPFELIVRGVIKYELPLSSRIQNAAIVGSVVVHPEKGIDANGTMFTETTAEHESHGGGDFFLIEDGAEN